MKYLDECIKEGTVSIFEYLQDTDTWKGWWKRDLGYIDNTHDYAQSLPKRETLCGTLWLYENYYLYQENIISAAFFENHYNVINYIIQHKWIAPERNLKQFLDYMQCINTQEKLEMFQTYVNLEEIPNYEGFYQNMLWTGMFFESVICGWILRHQHIHTWNIGILIEKSPPKFTKTEVIYKILDSVKWNKDPRQVEFVVNRILMINNVFFSMHSDITISDQMLTENPSWCNKFGPKIMQYVDFDYCPCDNKDNHIFLPKKKQKMLFD